MYSIQNPYPDRIQNIYSLQIDGIIECDGPQSCKNAQITGAVIGCHSMESCSDADITSYGPLTIFGYRGAYRASIDADIIDF